MSNEQADKEILYELFRYHQYVIGTTETCLIALSSLIVAIRELKCKTGLIREQINDFFETIKNSRPKLVIMVNAIFQFEKEIEENKIFEHNDADRIKGGIIDCIEGYIRILNDNIDQLVDHGVKHIRDGDCIIVHSVNEPVQRIIPAAKRRGKKIKVLILRQDPRKTEQVMRYMNSEGVDYVVTPEHELSHFARRADKLFIGAVAITGDGKVVCAAGTSNIVSIARLCNLPVYLFVNSLKFSHLPGDEHNINEKERAKSLDDIDYVEISYSHDLLDLNSIDHVFTENGRIGERETEKYNKTDTPKMIQRTPNPDKGEKSA